MKLKVVFVYIYKIEILRGYFARSTDIREAAKVVVVKNAVR